MACGHEAAPHPTPATASSVSASFSPSPSSSASSSPSSSSSSPSSDAPLPPPPSNAGAFPAASPAIVADLPIPTATKLVVSRAWQGPGAFAALFIAGFVVAFAGGAVVTWRGHDPGALLADGRFDDALVVIAAASNPSPQWRRIEGHALHARGDLNGMLLAYQKALSGDAVDDRCLQHTIEALGHEQTAGLALTLLQDWPGGVLVDDALLAAATDGVWLRRHGAAEALGRRPSATPTTRLHAAVKNAVADTRSDVCGYKQAGVNALNVLADQTEAAPLLKKAGAWNAVYDLNDAVIMHFPCLNKDAIRRTDASLAKVERE